MQWILATFFRERFLKGSFCFFLISLCLPAQAANPCYTLLQNYVQLRLDKKAGLFKSYAEFDPNEVEVLGHAERYNSHGKIETVRDFQKPPKVVVGLEPKVYGKIRSEDQINAWFQNISGKFRKIREEIADAQVARARSNDSSSLTMPPSSLMSVESFLGILDGAFGSQRYSIGKILKDFDIKHLRFVRGDSFEAVHRKILKKDEIVLELPDFDFENRLEAALWMKSLILSIHEAARKQVSLKLDAAKKPSDGKILWEEDSGDGVSYKEKTKNLDLAVGDMLQELTHYIENLTSAFMQNELVDLPEKNFKYQKAYPLVSYSVEAMNLIPGTQFIPKAIKVIHPLDWYKPSRLWIEGEEAILLERQILEERMRSYFSRKKRAYVIDKAQNYILGAGLVVIGYTYASNGTVLKNFQSRVQQLKSDMAQLNKDSSDKSNLDEKDRLRNEYKKLKALLEKAIENNQDEEVLILKEKMSEILETLAALETDN
jgi:hypothetical protein